MFGCETIMATRFGRTFTTRRGRRGRYKYVNGRKVSFEATKRNSRSMRYRAKRKTYMRNRRY